MWGWMGQVGQIASLAYEDGSMSSTAAVLTSNNPQMVLSQSAFLIHLSTSRQEQLNQVITTASQLAGAKQYARRITTAVAGLKRQLAAQKATLDKLIAKRLCRDSDIPTPEWHVLAPDHDVDVVAQAEGVGVALEGEGAREVG